MNSLSGRSSNFCSKFPLSKTATKEKGQQMQRGNRLKHWPPIPSGSCVNGLPEEAVFTPCWFAHCRNYLLFKCLMTFVALLVLTNPNIFITT
ncbi:hypothetical protein QQF64_018874 [Cirrhinus molitorella]|uniref:Uncharacterized protein n=1 Tax=Cirrhinus molitorella TaxID=172907 RepID=A0ABR3LE17_9TELE